MIYIYRNTKTSEALVTTEIVDSPDYDSCIELTEEYAAELLGMLGSIVEEACLLMIEAVEGMSLETVEKLNDFIEKYHDGDIDNG